MKRMFMGGGAIVGITAFLMVSCIPEGDRKLGIPYRAQNSFNYCAAATILMWRLYDGLPEVSQSTIFNWMGGVGCSTQPNIAAAVNYFTNTRDAYWDYGNGTKYREMAARQITAFDRQTPSIVAYQRNHAAVVNGGSWHVEGQYRVWDNIYLHDPDPAAGKNLYLAAGDWIYAFCPPGAAFCDQIISDGATWDWQVHYSNYGDSVKIYGWDKDFGGPRVY